MGILTVLFSIVVFLILLTVVIVVHELGHFFFAKRAGILCYEFSLGMGPALWSTKRGETTYSIRAIPIGGYVAMAGEEISSDVVKEDQEVKLVLSDNVITKIIVDLDTEGYESLPLTVVEELDLNGMDGAKLHINGVEVDRECFYVFKKHEMQLAPYDRTFQAKSLGDRFLTTFGGPLMNLVLAVFIFFLVGLLIGFPSNDSTKIGEVIEGYPAYNVIEENDTIISINGVDVDTYADINDELKNNLGDRTIDLVVLRDGDNVDLVITPKIIIFSTGFISAITDNEDDVVLSTVGEGTIADKAGFTEGDQIVSVNGESIDNWTEFVNVMVDYSNIKPDGEGSEMTFVVMREGGEVTLKVTPYSKDVVNYQDYDVAESYVGISPARDFNFLESVKYSVTGTVSSVTKIVGTIKLLFNNNQVGVGDLAGPVGIYQITSIMLSGGFITLLSWAGLLSVNLGVVNLLPIPALDGGRIVFLGYEGIFRKPVSKQVENTLHSLMFIALMGLFVFITYNDILRLIGLK